MKPNAKSQIDSQSIPYRRRHPERRRFSAGAKDLACCARVLAMSFVILTSLALAQDMPMFRWENFTAENGLPDNHLYTVLVDGNRIWAGTDNGLGLYDNGTWKVFRPDPAAKEESLAHRLVREAFLFRCGIGPKDVPRADVIEAKSFVCAGPDSVAIHKHGVQVVIGKAVLRGEILPA